MKKALLFVAAATLFFSCSKEIEPVSEDTASSGFTFKASIENLATKADMDESYGLLWAENDKIGIGVTGWGECQPFTLNSTAGSAVGDFEWDFYPGSEGDLDKIKADAYAAFFPWQGQGGSYNSAWDGVVYFKMQGSYGNALDLDSTPYTSGKMLTPLVGAVSNESIAFKHAGAAVKVTINNLPAGSHSIGMSADQQLYGDYHINVADAGTSAMVLDGDANASLNTIWLNYAAADAERPFTFIFPTPALTTPKLSFQIWDENGVLVWSKNLKAQTKSLGRGQILAMPAIDIVPYGQFNSVSENWVLRGNMTDNNWANDVAVATDGTLFIAKGLSFPAYGEFKIKHPGDSWDGSWPDGNYKINNEEAGEYDVIFNATSVVKVAPSKCPYPTAEYASTHHTSITGATNIGETETANCYVITAPGAYKFPVVKGNSSESAGDIAGVSLLWETYNNSDAVTAKSVIAKVDYDETEKFVYFKTPSTLKPGNAVIAALDADENILWSWHIWIPATEIKEFGKYSVSSKYWMDRNLGALTAVAGDNGVNYGLLYQWGRPHPRIGLDETGSKTYAKTSPAGACSVVNTTDGEKTMADAIKNPTVTFSNNHCWYNPLTGDELWSTTKTIYDPCPAGWRVPEHGIINLWSGVEDATNGGIDFDGLYFPATGSLSRYGGTWPETNSIYWSCDTYKDDAKQRAYWYVFQNGSSFDTSKEYKTTTAPVRCVKIEGSVPKFSAEEKANAEDKSADKSANCYVVNAGDDSNKSKVFKFKTVKGNSNESVGSVSYASVIWETWNDASTVTARSVIDAVTYSDGYVYFRMPAVIHPGNALIAVKDSEGKILWSWHIWVPATDVAPIDNGIHTKPMMDRNLGALNVAVASATDKIDVTSMGMWYQWGRKDPFPGPRSIDTEGEYSGFAKVSGTSPSAQKIQISLAESIQNPTLFARGKYEIVDEKETLTSSDWNSTADGTLWGDETDKSIYDPCPAGYRVPNRDKNTPLWKTDMTQETGWGFNATNYWFTLGNPASVFPCAGYCDGGSAKVTFRTVLWNAHHNSSGNADEAYNIYIYLSSGNPAFANYSHGKSRGNYVRCCVE